MIPTIKSPSIHVFLFLLVALFISHSYSHPLKSTINYMYSNFELLPEYHINSDLITFFLHKNQYFKQRYYLENNTKLSFVFVSFKKLFYSIWNIEYGTGMGQTPGNIVFDPMDISFGILPSIQIRLPFLYIQPGIDHHCFHEIDRSQLPTVYYNKGFITIGSPLMHIHTFWKHLLEVPDWNNAHIIADKTSWYITYGSYARSFFNLVRPSKINGQNPLLWDIDCHIRYAFYKRNSWVLVFYPQFKTGTYIEVPKNKIFWIFNTTVESYFRRGKNGAQLFITYSLDALPLYNNNTTPRFSKDRLLQGGLKFFL